MADRVVIVGAGQAGSSAAAFLRQFGFEGEITLIGEEPLAPYQRPPLSKAWLKGEANADDLLLRAGSFYSEHDIALRTGVEVTAIDRQARAVITAGGPVEYDTLIIATGARPRPLPIPGANLTGVLELRTAADAEALKAQLSPGRRLAVIGAGYIGLEVAASARALGAEVVVIERETRVLGRVACEPLSDFFQAYHEARGVTFELGASVTAFEGEGAVTGVHLADGRSIACDVALVGIGAVPDDALARDAGLACKDGVIVDIEARTSDPAIYAAGDVTWRPLPLYGRDFRLESVPNAIEQGRQAAASIAGRPPPPAEVPWFWSDQYDLKLQIAGLAFDADQLVTRGDAATGMFALFHLRQGRVLAVEAVNAGAEFMGGRLLIASGKPVDPARLADTSISMKAVAA